MDILHAHVFAKRSQSPAHADGGQSDGHLVQVTQMFPDAFVRPQQVGLQQQQRHRLAERVQQTQHAQVAHLELDVPEVDGQEQFEVPETQRGRMVKTVAVSAAATFVGRHSNAPPQYAQLDEVQRLDGGALDAVGRGRLVADRAGRQVPPQRHGLFDGSGRAHEQHGQPERHVAAVRVERVAHDHVEHDVAEVRGQRDDVEQYVAQRQELMLGHGTVGR